MSVHLVGSLTDGKSSGLGGGGIGIAPINGEMLELARPETRVGVRAQPARSSWGVVDVILGVLMLPFGIWMLVIEGMVRGVAAFGRR